MGDEIPAEVYEAAARAIHDRECADGSMCTATPTSMTRYAELGRVAADAVWSLAYAAGRQSIYDGWAAKLVEDAVPDDPEALRAMVRRDCRALVEAEIRAEVLKAAARSLLAKAEAFDEKWCRHREEIDRWDMGYVAGMQRAANDVANSIDREPGEAP